MSKSISVFGLFEIYWYGIIIAFGVLLGLLLAMRNAKVFGEDDDSVVDLALITIPLAVIGARLYYVIFAWDQFKGNLLSIINIRQGGLAIYGGVIGGILAGLIFSRWKKKDFWNLADICASSLILGQAIGRWGNYINQEAYGKLITDPEWQWFPAAVFIESENNWFMATFFYESVWNFIVFFILMSFRKRRKRTGEVFLLYLILYSTGRFFIEGLRTDSLYIGGIRVSQLLSALLFIFGIAMFVYRRKHALSPNANIVPAEGPAIDSLETEPEEEEKEENGDKCEQVLTQEEKLQEETPTQDDNPLEEIPTQDDNQQEEAMPQGDMPQGDIPQEKALTQDDNPREEASAQSDKPQEDKDQTE